MFSQSFSPNEEWSSTKATLDQAMQIIASIQPQEDGGDIYYKLQQTICILTTRAEEISASMAGFGAQDSSELAPPSPFDAAMQKAPFISTTAPPQRQDSDIVAELLKMGFPDVEEVKYAVKQAHGNIEVAISYLCNNSSPVKSRKTKEIPKLMDPFVYKATGQEINNNVAYNHTNYIIPTKRQATYFSSPVTAATPPSPADNADSPAFSYFQTPSTPFIISYSQPTHSPDASKFFASRKSKMTPEEQDALFAAVQRLAPTKNVVGCVWEKIRADLASLGFKKTQAAWKTEWSRYGAYDNSFDEKNGVFVTSEEERLELLRCLDSKDKAAVKRAREGLGEVEEIGSGKRQKGPEVFDAIDGGFVLTGEEMPVSPLPEFSQHGFVEETEHVEEPQTPEVKIPIHFDLPDSDAVGFRLEDGSNSLITNDWVFGDVENGLGSWSWAGDDFGLDFGDDFGVGYDTSFDAGSTLEALGNGYSSVNRDGFMA